MVQSDEVIRKEIVEEIERFARDDISNRLELDGSPIFDSPLIGFVSGSDPIFTELKSIIGDFHLTPSEAMKKVAELRELEIPNDGSLGVIVYILPMAKETVKENANMADRPSQRWVHSKFYGERFFKSLSADLSAFLRQKGWIAFSPEEESSLFCINGDLQAGIASTWSLRHIAYAAGLGTFGLSDGLITEAGIAEAVGSVVVNIPFDSPTRPSDIHAACLHFQNGKCMACARRCPAGAISEKGHDKNKCAVFAFSQTPLNKERYGLETYSCGLCFTKVPCSSCNPTRGK